MAFIAANFWKVSNEENDYSTSVIKYIAWFSQ